MPTDQATLRADTGLDTAGRVLAPLGRSRCRRLYHAPTFASTAMASMAASANHARLACPCGMMIQAASNGPIALPALPPTWKMDCARPWRPPEARRAIREDSGWKIDEPAPINAAAANTLA